MRSIRLSLVVYFLALLACAVGAAAWLAYQTCDETLQQKKEAARKVKRAGQSIHLTPKEYALLEFLAFHRGKVVTRSIIWEHLYDDQDENTSNVVDVYIRYLRNKIDKGFEPPLIQTRWGEGYLLRGDDA